MGMTIDEAIVWLNTDDFESKGFADATSVAMDTMHKYQKIEEIIKDTPYGCDCDDAVRRIQEVIEDGNDD